MKSCGSDCGDLISLVFFFRLRFRQKFNCVFSLLSLASLIFVPRSIFFRSHVNITVVPTWQCLTGA